jgi:hypothetical protein
VVFPRSNFGEKCDLEGADMRLDSLFPFCSNRAMTEWGELSIKVVRLETAGQEVLARAGNILVARAAFDMCVSLYQAAEIELRQGSRVIRSSKP